MKSMLAGLIVAIAPVAPVALSGQGISAPAVIPTQSLLTRTWLPGLTQFHQSVVAVAPPVRPSCDMPVVAPDGYGATEGGITPPPDNAISIPVLRSGCVNRMAVHASDNQLLKTP